MKKILTLVTLFISFELFSAEGSTSKGKILIVVANPAVSTTLGWPVGFWGAELTHPYLEFTEAGYEVEIVSPKGGKVELDAYSDPRDQSGYSKNDLITLGFISSPEHAKLLENTKSISNVQMKDYKALIVAGGQSPMFTFRDNPELQKLFLDFYYSGKPTAALCHGTALLLDLKDKKGKPFIKGRKITGFANSEEDFADKVVGQKVMPFRIEDEAKKLGAKFMVKPAFSPFAVQDKNLITGQQQNSGKEVAKLVLKSLK
ncbi:MAG: type 1 glutamine amidotransferase domain-containing protein [Bacteriovoracaceae bacterium]